MSYGNNTRLLALKELLRYQKSICKWLKCGDKNSKCFYTAALIKRRRNRIEGLKDEQGEWVFEQKELQSIALQYYKALFSSEVSSSQYYCKLCPGPDGIHAFFCHEYWDLV